MEEGADSRHDNQSLPEILKNAVRDGDVPKFEKTRHEFKAAAREDELPGLIQPRQDGGSMLSDAVKSGSIGIFKSVLNCARSALGHHQFRELLEHQDENGERLLQSKAASAKFGEALLVWMIEDGDLGLFEAAVECVVSERRLNEQASSQYEGDDQEEKRREERGAGQHYVPPNDSAGARAGNEEETQEEKQGAGQHHVPPNVSVGAQMASDRSILSGVLEVSMKRQRSTGVFKESHRSKNRSSYIKDLLDDFIRDQRNPQRQGERHLLCVVLFGHDFWLLNAVTRCATSTPRQKIAEERSATMDGIFSTCVDLVWAAEHPLDRDLKTMSSIIANSARPSAESLAKLLRKCEDSFKGFCLRAVTTAINPFVSGMMLSTSLGEAASKAYDGEKHKLGEIKASVDSLLREIFERLPQAVGGFPGGATACCAILEPKIKGQIEKTDSPLGLKGPLTLMLQKATTRDTFSSVPLIIDFLSYRFTQGLPDLHDTYGVLGHREILDEDLSIRDRFFYCLHGGHHNVPSLTMLPGAQYIVAGIVARPNDFYQVPITRMVLDFVVYLTMVAALSYFVLYQGDEGALGWQEGCFASIFILGGLYREKREMARGFFLYLRDRWNIFDVLGLLCLIVGLILRLATATRSGWKTLYALSAPLLVCRVLFFAQILPFQGPMIEVVFGMTRTLLKFGLVMVTVVVGFAMSFHVLFQDLDTFSVTTLKLFKAMLGDVELFEDFPDERYIGVATALLVVYLVIVTITLLNLLVAIMSTSHAQVDSHLEQEFNESKGRMIEHYLLVVEKDLLPAPFNLIQLAVRLWRTCLRCEKKNDGDVTCFTEPKNTHSPPDGWHMSTVQAHKTLTRPFGRIVFCGFVGSVAVFGGAILWIASTPYALYVCHEHLRLEKHYKKHKAAKGNRHRDCSVREELHQKSRAKERKNGGQSRAVPLLVFLQGLLAYSATFLWCVVVAPLSLVSLWLLSFCCCLFPCLDSLCTICSSSRKRKQDKAAGTPRSAQSESGVNDRTGNTRGIGTVEGMLKNAPGKVGVEDLSRFLENPMTDRVLRQDDRRHTTVEHIKLLRDRLEETTKIELEASFRSLREECQTTNKRLDKIENRLEGILALLATQNS